MHTQQYPRVDSASNIEASSLHLDMMVNLDESDLVCRVGMKNLIENWVRSQNLDRIHVLIIIMGDRMFDQSLFRNLDIIGVFILEIG